MNRTVIVILAVFLAVLSATGAANAQDTGFVLAESIHDKPIIATGRIEADASDDCTAGDRACSDDQSRKFVVRAPKVWIGQFNDEVTRHGRVRLLSTAQNASAGVLRANEHVLLILYGTKASPYIPGESHRAIPTIGAASDPYVAWSDEVARMLPCGASTLVKPVPHGTEGATWPSTQGIRVATLTAFIRKQDLQQDEFFCRGLGEQAWAVDVPAGMLENDQRLIAKCEVKFAVDRTGRTTDIEIVKFSGSERLRDMCRIKTQQLRMPFATDSKGVPKRAQYRTNFDFDKYGFTSFWFGNRPPAARVYFAGFNLKGVEKTLVDAKGMIQDPKDLDYRHVTVVALPSGATLQARGLSEGAIYMPPMGSEKDVKARFGQKADFVIVTSNPKCTPISDITVMAYVEGTRMTQRNDVRAKYCSVRPPPQLKK